MDTIDIMIVVVICVIVLELVSLCPFPLPLPIEGFAGFDLNGGPPPFDVMEAASDHTDMTPDVDDDGRDIPWITSWSAADKRARRGHNCNPTYKQLGPDNTVIYTTTKSCEDGMPHTRIGGRIYIPDNNSTVVRDEIIRHELIHVEQRRNPTLWTDFYRRSWSFILYTSPPPGLPQNIIDAKRSNPDTWDPAMGGQWACWQGRWWPIAIYRDAFNPRLRDVNIVFWDAWKQEAYSQAPQDWFSFFGTPNQTEHPHELSACYIVSGDTQSEAGRRLLTWRQSRPPK